MTDKTRAQGNLEMIQLESSLYLSLYNLSDIFSHEIERLNNVVVGHREINDLTGQGAGGKPDFFGSVMSEAFRPKLHELASQLGYQT